MNKFKKALTLAELMVIMFIISVIVIITLTTQKPFDKGTALLYNRAFVALNTAIYNIDQDLVSPKTLMNMSTVEFCEALAEAEKGYFNTNSISCNANTVSLQATDNQFVPSAVQFVASNGMIAYLSHVETMAVDNAGTPFDIQYRVVFFDLNGERRPNTAVWSQNRMADIVGFLVTQFGDVLPIGYPEIDKRYLSAKIHYPDGDTDEELDRYSDSISYYEAKAKAWGVAPENYNIHEIMSINFYNNFPIGNLKITTFPTAPPIDTAKDCNAATVSTLSECEIEFNQYIN